MPNAYNIDTAEDITGQAGWMFSDMLVALMVVFLATITFIPDFAMGGDGTGGAGTGGTGSGGNGTSQSGDYTYVEHFDKVFIQVYSTKALGADLVRDVSQFFSVNNLPSNAIVDSAQVIGGYQADTEQPSKAVDRASKFVRLLDADYPQLLEHASTVLNSSPSLRPDQLTVRLTFSSNVTTDR